MGALLSKSSMPIVKWVAEVMGWLMNGIYKIGIHNLGLCIILFTIIIYAFMIPLQIKQQKFSKMNAVMSPELQKISKKYRAVFVPLQDALIKEASRVGMDAITIDGIHLTPLGHQFLAEKIYSSITERF